MKLAVINQHTRNVGDEAAGVALALQLRDLFPKCQLHFVYAGLAICKEQDGIPLHDSRTFHHAFQFRKHDYGPTVAYLAARAGGRWPRFRRDTLGAYRKLLADMDRVLVSPSGANIGIYRSWGSLFCALVAVLEGHRPIFCLNTIGRSGNRIFDLAARFVLRRSDVFVREGRSYAELAHWGVNCCRGTDVVLSLPDCYLGSLGRCGLPDEMPYVALVPSRLSWHPHFRRLDVEKEVRAHLLPKLVSHCLKHSLGIRILAHIKTLQGTAEDDLLHETRTTLISCGMDSSHVAVDYLSRDFRCYGAAIAQSKLVVSMRYHGVIFAIRHAIPFVSLAYENKMQEACTYAGMSRFNVDLAQDLSQVDFSGLLATATCKSREITTALSARRAVLDGLARLPAQKLYLDLCDHSAQTESPRC